MGDPNRSYKPIRTADLQRLAVIARTDLEGFFRRHPDWRAQYSDRLLCIALCQGAALHYVNGSNGTKDFDVWSFFAPHPARAMYARRRGQVDFGDPRFGRSPDKPEYVGRRVDLMFRSIPSALGDDPVKALRQYLSAPKTTSARYLSEKVAVLIHPRELLGTVIWPIGAEPYTETGESKTKRPLI